MISLITGDDHYNIQKKLDEFKAELGEGLQWNYETMEADSKDFRLADAIDAVRQMPFVPPKRLVVVTGCNLKDEKQFGQAELDLLNSVDLPETAHLVLVATHYDRRQATYKTIAKVGKAYHFEKRSEWQAGLIESDIQSLAKQHQLNLLQPQISYLAGAVGNDLMKAASELQKLVLVAEDGKISDELLHELIPSELYSGFTLAAAIREGNVLLTMQEATKLEELGLSPFNTLGLLQNRFRLWLLVKALIAEGKKDWEIAKLCELGNHRQMYYLRKDVAPLSIGDLTYAKERLLALDCDLKRSYSSKFVPSLVTLASHFSHAKSHKRAA